MMRAARDWTVLLSGPVCTGKTSLAMSLAVKFGAQVLTTRALIAARAGENPERLDRRRLQELGRRLDAQEGGAWVATALRSLLPHTPAGAPAVVDAVRTLAQAEAVKALTPTLWVHLTAPNDVLAARYEHRRRERPELELANYEDVRADPTEAEVQQLAAAADLVIDTYLASKNTTAAAVTTCLRKAPPCSP